MHFDETPAGAKRLENAKIPAGERLSKEAADEGRDGMLSVP